MKNNKQGEGGLAIVAILAMILIVAGLVVFFIVRNSEALAIGENHSGPEHEEKPETEILRTSLSRLYHEQIDPLAPAYLSIRETDCGTAMGEWRDDRNNVGCFDIPVWDSSACVLGEVVTLGNVCRSIEGTTWTCDAHNVGCSY